MPIKTIKAGGRYFNVTPDVTNLPGFPFLELGPAGTTTDVSTMVVQFSPSQQFDGQFNVMGRVLGVASDTADVAFVPIPYRRVSLGDIAQDFAYSTAPIIGPALIFIPASGLSIALQLAPPGSGECDVVMWDLKGSSAV